MSTAHTTVTAGALAHQQGGRLEGPAEITLTGVASLREAAESDISFLGNDRYSGQVAESRAGLVLLPENFPGAPAAGRAWLRVKDPSAVFMQVVMRFAPPPPVFEPGFRHPAAVIHPAARIAATAHVGANAVIEAGATVGERTVVGALCYLGQEAVLGDDTFLHPNVTIRERCRLGNRVIIHSGTTIGSDGFGYIPNLTGGLHTKIPQVGIVQIDDDVEVGANVAVDRARFGRTWIKRGAKIDNLVQIAHNVEIGELSFVIAQVGISGSSRLGRGCVLWGQAGLAGHLDIGDGAQVLAQAGVAKDVPPGARVVGAPAVPEREFIRDLFNVHRVDKLAATVRELKKQLAELTAARPG